MINLKSIKQKIIDLKKIQESIEQEKDFLDTSKKIYIQEKKELDENEKDEQNPIRKLKNARTRTKLEAEEERLDNIEHQIEEKEAEVKSEYDQIAKDLKTMIIKRKAVISMNEDNLDALEAEWDLLEGIRVILENHHLIKYKLEELQEIFDEFHGFADSAKDKRAEFVLGLSAKSNKKNNLSEIDKETKTIFENDIEEQNEPEI